MPYTISGDSYKEIAARKFSQGRSFTAFKNESVEIPFVRHQVQHSFNEDFGIIQFQADFLQDIQISHVRDVPHVSLHFQMKGNSNAHFEGISGDQPLLTGEFNMYSSENFNSNLYFKRQKDFEYLAITFKREYLLSILDQFNYPFKNIESLLKSGTTFALAEKAMRISPEIYQALYALLNSPVSDDYLHVYRKSKVEEILALQFSRFSGEASHHSMKYIDQKEIKAVYNYIVSHFLDIHTMSDVTKHFSLTAYQVKQQLRRQFDTSLYELIHEKRMDYAMQLLRQTDMNVNEVACQIGYANTSNFIYAFKRNFHFTPKQVKLR